MLFRLVLMVTFVVAAAPLCAQDAGLPSDRGQVFREYDISPYTLRATATTVERPQQEIVDWVLRDTGYETWHSDTVSVLGATRSKLRVFHTPDVQRQVSDIVARFVDDDAAKHSYSVRVITIGHPDWRSRAQKLLEPIPIQTQGAEAWLLAKEDAAMLLADIRKRADFRSHASPKMSVSNGQHATINLGRPRSYTRSVMAPGGETVGGNQNLGQINEGIRLELSPLLSRDGRFVDAMVKCEIDQLERLVPVRLEVPGSLAQARQWYNIEVPQVVSCRLHEQFRWPQEKVLLVSTGVAPRPIVEAKSPLKLPFRAISSDSPPRGDALIFVTSNGMTLRTAESGELVPQTETFRGRY